MSITMTLPGFSGVSTSARIFCSYNALPRAAISSLGRAGRILIPFSITVSSIPLYGDRLPRYCRLFPRQLRQHRLILLRNHLHKLWQRCRPIVQNLLCPMAAGVGVMGFYQVVKNRHVLGVFHLFEQDRSAAAIYAGEEPLVLIQDIGRAAAHSRGE